MRLTVKPKQGQPRQYSFTDGPVYIGRHANSQVYLPDRGISRQHAVIFKTNEGKWVVEDMDSANKTYLNGEVIDKAELKTGDTISISDFNIEVILEDISDEDIPINLEDTLVGDIPEPQIIVRKADAEKAPAIRLPGKRAKDFFEATKSVAKAADIDNVLLTLLQIANKQFNAAHTWCALRNVPDGPMTCHSGRTRAGEDFAFDAIELGDKITQAIDNSEFLLIPRVPSSMTKKLIGSIMVAPVIGPAGCYGVLYIDNNKTNESYVVGDLDYLMLLSVHAASVIEKL